jgi:hypothetical protein
MKTAAPRLRRRFARTRRFAEGVIMDEKRAVLRRRTYFQARLSSRDGIGWTHAVVRNLSDRGALIEAVNQPIPEEAELSIAQTGLRARAHVAWRDGFRAGLSLAPSTAPRPAARLPDDDPNY